MGQRSGQGPSHLTTFQFSPLDSPEPSPLHTPTASGDGATYEFQEETILSQRWVALLDRYLPLLSVVLATGQSSTEPKQRYRDKKYAR